MAQKRDGYSKLKKDGDECSSRSDSDEDLEYHVTFPRNFKESDSDSEGESSEGSGEATATRRDTVKHKRRPVVVLLGWLGCKDRYLSKYAEIYQNDHVSLRICANCSMFPSKAEARRYAQRTLDILFDYEYDRSPIVFHSFSNFGTILLLNIIALMDEQRESKQPVSSNRYDKLNIRGVIFDSAPGRARFMSGYRALCASIRTQWAVLRLLMKLTIFLFFLWQVVARWVLGRVRSLLGHGQSQAGDTLLEFYASAKHHDTVWRNELYLYSRGDELVYWHDVEELAHFRQSRSHMNVSTRCWADSEHVAHYRKHKDEYTKLCLDFVAQCNN